jgi:DNA invertase Pin-like site-specific DNA recombinase
VEEGRLDHIRVAFYTRDSTSAQCVENQRHELRRVAEARQWNVVHEYSDDGISGRKTRNERPGLDALIKAATRGEFDVLAMWSIDRLGRSLQHLVETVNELRSLGIHLYFHQQALDTGTAAGRFGFQIFGALAEFERELIRERIRAGLDRAKRNGTKLGRATNLNASVRAVIIALRANDQPIRRSLHNLE